MTDELWLIWSNDHRAWFTPGGNGFTTITGEAGVYATAAADEIMAASNSLAVPAPTKEQVCTDMFRLGMQTAEARRALNTAYHALEAYAHGNASPDLARSIAEFLKERLEAHGWRLHA